MEKDFALKKTFDRDGQNFDPPAGVRIALGLRTKATLPAAFPHPFRTHHHSTSTPNQAAQLHASHTALQQLGHLFPVACAL
jgi:hypothetical protein